MGLSYLRLSCCYSDLPGGPQSAASSPLQFRKVRVIDALAPAVSQGSPGTAAPLFLYGPNPAERHSLQSPPHQLGSRQDLASAQQRHLVAFDVEPLGDKAHGGDWAPMEEDAFTPYLPQGSRSCASNGDARAHGLKSNKATDLIVDSMSLM